MQVKMLVLCGIMVLSLIGCGGGTTVSTQPNSDQEYNIKYHVWDYFATGPYVGWYCKNKYTGGIVSDKRCADIQKVDAYTTNNAVPNPNYPSLSSVYAGMPIETLCAYPMQKLRDQYPNDYLVEYSTSTVADTLYTYDFEPNHGLDYFKRYYLDSEYVRESGTNVIAVVWSRPLVKVPKYYQLTVNGVTEDKVYYVDQVDKIIWTIQRSRFPQVWYDCFSRGVVTTIDDSGKYNTNYWNWSFR